MNGNIENANTTLELVRYLFINLFRNANSFTYAQKLHNFLNVCINTSAEQR